MISSGLTAGATADDTPVRVKNFGANARKRVVIVNTGDVFGFFSLVGNSANEADWGALPSGSVSIPGGANTDVWIRRVAGGSNVTGVYAWVEEQ